MYEKVFSEKSNEQICYDDEGSSNLNQKGNELV